MLFYWACLGVAIVVELFAAMSLKKLAVDETIHHKIPLLLGLLFIVYPFLQRFHFEALKKIDISLAYLIWTGVGCTASVILGRCLFSEPITPTKCIGMGLIIAGAFILLKE
ncbi:MAG: QacE family quaternary ammonium compound efflux SMR transporter [Gammaproteobacteria bacterium]|nr:QacE family quaternary ammonium compound efflux SMR transporter [Gammaproteobacteria bacterium]